MIGDTLLDYVHVSASPTVLFDDRGDILYVNTSLSRNDWGASAVEQLASTVKASLKNLPPRCSTSRIKSDVARTGEFYPSLASEEASRYAGESNNDGASTDDNNTPGPSDVLQTTQWRLTASSCQRILAIAQESKEEQFPDYSPEEMQTLKATVPVVNVPWRKQKRFNGLVSGGGEMGDLVRNFDWSKHPLGAIETWPQARVEMVSLLLRSPVPMTAYQEADAFVIYNDAYRQVLGPSKHPRCLGQPARLVWAEIWEFIEKPLADAMAGIPTERINDQLFFDRLHDAPNPNTMEEVYATWFYLPYWGNGRYIGNMHLLFEEAGRMNPISARRIETIADLSARLSSSRSTIDLCRNALDVLSGLEIDLPYCLAYSKVAYEPPELLEAVGNTNGSSGASPDARIISISSAGSSCSREFEEQKNIHVFALQETVGAAFDSPLAPSRLMIDIEDDAGSPSAEGGLTPLATPGGHAMPHPAWQEALADVLRTGDMVVVDNVQQWMKGVPHRGLASILPYRAVAIPLKQGSEVVGCIMLLLNGGLPWSTDYKRFIDIIARQLNLSLSMVRTFEHEVQRAEELAALDRAKTSFFTSVSHELRTPLTLILGPIKELLDDTGLSRRQSSSISMVYRNARRLLRLVNSILDFARAEAGKLSSQFAPMALGPITMELASSFRSAIESAGLTFVTENNAPDDTIVWIDIDKWEKIVFNLISNAFKFTTEGTVTVKTFVDNLNFYLVVEDTGIGIPANEISSVFERFVRVENSEARSVEGSGIGLSLTLELVRLHGGKIGVDSIFKKGTAFKLKIPLGNSHLPKAYLANASTMHAQTALRRGNASDDFKQPLSDEFSGVGTRSESVTGTEDSPEGNAKLDDLWTPLLFGERDRARILLADDNADLRSFIRSILAKYADVVEAVDGQAAWNLLEREEFDLVLSDITMPRLSGFQLLAKIRASEKLKNKPVILLSARAGEDAGVESLSSGADDHLNKPFSSKELILRVHSHLQLAAIRSELEVRVNQRTAALAEAKETFQRLSELLQVAVHRSDRNGNVIWANKKWFKMLGLEDGNLDNWGERIHPDDLASAIGYYTEAIDSGESYSHPIEMRLLSWGDEIVETTYELRAESGSAGECIGFVGVFSDVTVLRKLERERISTEQARRQEAEENRQQQETFIDVICHELRNPLNAIYNSAELLGESLGRFAKLSGERPDLDAALGPLQADLREDLEAVETILLSSRHQKRIADDVLHISKISGNLVQLVAAEWEPIACLKNTLKMFNLEVSAKSIDLKLECDPSMTMLGTTVIGDEGRFTQVCVNLLSNAIKFLEGTVRKKISVRVGATPLLDEAILHRLLDADTFSLNDLTPLCGPYATTWPDSSATEALLHVAIHDTGPGMSVEEQGKIFKRYAQASPRTYRAFGGVGLGLWISRRLVELHGGAVALQSESGVGTVFRMYIKVGRKSQAVPTAPTGSSLANGSIAPDPPPAVPSGPALTGSTPTKLHLSERRPRILVVEDNDVNSKVLVRLLANLKCDVTTAYDGADCLAKLTILRAAATYPDLIFMDLEMPVMDGLTATQHIRADETQRGGSRVIIVAVSANARQVYQTLSEEAGMDGFLRKPYNRMQLTETLHQFIEYSV